MLKMNIKKLMIKNDLTITEISKITGISRTTINNLVNGKEEPKALQLETMYQLSAVFGVPIDSLFEMPIISYSVQFNDDIKIVSDWNEKGIGILLPVSFLYNTYEIVNHFLIVNILLIENEETIIVRHNHKNLGVDLWNSFKVHKQIMEHSKKNNNESFAESMLIYARKESKLKRIFETIDINYFNFELEKFIKEEHIIETLLGNTYPIIILDEKVIY